MKLETRDFGIIEIKKKDIISFPDGLPGFLDKKKHVFLPVEGESPFIIMQSTDDPQIAFVTIEPGHFIQDYQFEIDTRSQKLLKIEDNSQITVFNIVTIKEKIKDITINLAAPLVVNFEEKIGKQIILDNENFPVHFPVFSQEQETEKVVK